MANVGTRNNLHTWLGDKATFAVLFLHCVPYLLNLIVLCNVCSQDIKAMETQRTTVLLFKKR